jgi:hypothetical protein
MSAKDSLGLYEVKQHKPWFDENLCLNIQDLYRAINDFKKGDVVTDSNSI